MRYTEIQEKIKARILAGMEKKEKPLHEAFDTAAMIREQFGIGTLFGGRKRETETPTTTPAAPAVTLGDVFQTGSETAQRVGTRVGDVASGEAQRVSQTVSPFVQSRQDTNRMGAQVGSMLAKHDPGYYGSASKRPDVENINPNTGKSRDISGDFMRTRLGTSPEMQAIQKGAQSLADIASARVGDTDVQQTASEFMGSNEFLRDVQSSEAGQAALTTAQDIAANPRNALTTAASNELVAKAVGDASVQQVMADPEIGAGAAALGRLFGLATGRQ